MKMMLRYRGHWFYWDRSRKNVSPFSSFARSWESFLIDRECSEVFRQCFDSSESWNEDIPASLKRSLW